MRDSGSSAVDATLPLFSIDQIDGRLPKAMQVYEIIRDAIISMKLPPGAPIVEKEICAQLGISRTPLREAILQLAKESLVNIYPSGGTFVNKIVLRDVLEGQLVRDTLEMRLVRLAARNFQVGFEREFDLALFKQKAAADRKDVDEFFALDNEFHKLVCTVAGHPNVWMTIHNSTGQLDRCRRQAFPIEGHFATVYAEHQEIYRCLKAKDEEGAAAAFQVQLDSTFPSLVLLREHLPELLQDYHEVDLSDIR
uniref:GntR family transcriptional regulator n=1 Tax=Mesorhizobium sp. WSM4875 TaxID=3038539 RepID=UPI0024172B5D|nr:GntR family transcriptional regulator [Mesorhizobium sp. WSM4875]WIE94648.1 GntR family transcriptional regulator [Mesorhizobium sp. WSM4875]